jgi:hypothetical protein
MAAREGVLRFYRTRGCRFVFTYPRSLGPFVPFCPPGPVEPNSAHKITHFARLIQYSAGEFKRLQDLAVVSIVEFAHVLAVDQVELSFLVVGQQQVVRRARLVGKPDLAAEGKVEVKIIERLLIEWSEIIENSEAAARGLQFQRAVTVVAPAAWRLEISAGNQDIDISAAICSRTSAGCGATDGHVVRPSRTRAGEGECRNMLQGIKRQYGPMAADGCWSANCDTAAREKSDTQDIAY